MLVLRAMLAATLSLTLLALAQGDSLRSFDGGAGWINSPALTATDLHGKVVLVDFWEYTCINCLRTLPYLREWYKRYSDKGFTIIGVQTPEFGFSGERSNISAAAQRLGITWPVVVDDNYTIWKRYDVQEWPTEYLFDQQGRLVETALGEGNYPQTEAAIQSLLRAANPHVSLPHVMALLPQDNYDKPGAVCYPKTNEIVVGQAPIANATAFDDPSQDSDYRDPGGHKSGLIYLDGYWHRSRQALVFGGGNGYVTFPYQAIQVVAVLTSNGSSHVNVTQDGKPIAREDAGKDVRYDANGDSYLLVDSSRAYDVIMNAKYGSHELRFYPRDNGVSAYDFAFESCEVPGATNR